MATFLGYRDGGKTNEEGLMKFLSRSMTSGIPTTFNTLSLQATQRAAGANMSVDIAIGDAHLILPNGQYSYWGWTDAVTNQTITTSDPTNPRIDVIYAYADLSVVSSASNNNPGAFKFGVSTGVAAASPVANSDATIQIAVGATTPFIKLATVLVGAAVTTITTSVITDVRTAIGGNIPTATAVGADGWTLAGETWAYGANNGQKEFTVTVVGDKTAKYPLGAKVKIPRSVAPPTQAMSFTAASNQYATKVTPTGLVFTAAFTIENWMYVSSYTGADVMFISRTDTAAANGWFAQIKSDATLAVTYASAANTTTFKTYQSVPLKRWYHVASVVTSVAAKTAVIYINGVSVPISNLTSAATALTQAGNLTFGRWDSPSQYFDGYLSEARIWSVAQTQAQVLANMAINLTGSETNLVGLFKGNGNFNDATANANNLTATNGATFVTANPLNAIEYGVITATSYSSPNTTLTIFCGTDYTIPNATLGAPSWSMLKPFGFPAQRGKWAITYIAFGSIQSQGTLTKGNWYNIGNIKITISTGEWAISYSYPAQMDSQASAYGYMNGTLSTSSSSESDKRLTTGAGASPGAGNTGTQGVVANLTSVPISISTTTNTDYYALLSPGVTSAGTVSTLYQLMDRSVLYIVAELATI